MASIEEMAKWACEHPTSGRTYAGRNAVMEHFGCTNHAARTAVALARKATSSNPTDPVEISVPAAPDPLNVMRENTRLRKDLEQYKALEECLRDVITEVIPQLPAYKRGERELPRRSKTEKHTAMLMLELSDWQVGMEVKPADSIGLGLYNFNVFLARLRQLRDTVLTIHDEWSRVRPIDTLVVNCLGDLLEGVNIYKGQGWYTDLHLADQWLKTLYHFGAFIRDIGLRIPNVRILAIPGNHGRIGMKGEAHRADNAELLLLLTEQLYLRQLKDVRMIVGRSSVVAYQLMGRVHLLAHGDMTRSWNTIPFYGFSRDTLKYQGMLRKQLDYAHFAHHHRDASWKESRARILLNGCLCGPSNYAIETFKSAEPPSQRLHLAHHEHGLAWSCGIEFKDIPELQADDEGIFTPVYRPEDIPTLDATKAGGW